MDEKLIEILENLNEVKRLNDNIEKAIVLIISEKL